MNAADGSSSSAAAAHQLLGGVVTQLSKGDPLSDSFSRHATAAVLGQQAVRALDAAAQPSKLHGTFQKVLELVLKRLSKGQAQEQALALQLLTACIRVCDAVTLLQKAVEWGTQISEVLRKAAAAVAQHQAAGVGAPEPACAVVQAACAAATELCSRLQQYVDLPAVRREVSGVAPKLLQPLLAVLNSSSSAQDSTQAAALQLAAALLRCVPSSLRPALSNLERALQQQVLRAAAGAAGSSVSTAGGPHRQQVLAQAAVCAALLPAVSGEAGAWSGTARRLMASCHDVLDLLLMGLESRPVDTQYRSYFAVSDTAQQQGQAAAPGATSLAGWLDTLPWLQQEQQEQQEQQQQQQGAALRRQTVPALLLVSFCLTALQHLLQQPFAVPVPVPGYSLSLLAARLHRFDAAAAVAAGAVPGSSTMYRELLVLQPQLQFAGWQLLQQVVRSCGQQLQLQGLLLRLVRQGMRAVQLSGPAGLQQQPPGVRSCLYETAALLLQATGLAGARALAAESMGCVVLELYGHTATATAGKAGAAAGQQRPAKRARKSGGATGTELGQFDPAAAVVAAAADESSRLAAATPADLKAQGAVLGVLRGLLAAGGQVLPAQVRAHADAVAYHISATAAQLAVQLGQQPALSAAAAAAAAAGSGSLAALQVAAYQALLASLLVPCSHRPPFLSQAVVLFRQGRASSNVGVAAVCQAGAMQVEALLHPRATAMGGVRQYSGMEGLPALTKPRMWDAFAPQQQPQQQQPPEQSRAAAYAGPGLTNGVQQQGSGPTGNDGRTAAAAAAAGPSQDNAAVVMGYPVRDTQQQQQPQQHYQQQQQQQQQQPLQAPAVFQQQPPVTSHTLQTGNGMGTPALQAPAPPAPLPQQRLMQEPPQGGSAMAIDADQPAAAAVQDNQGVVDWAPPPEPVVRAAPPPAATGIKAAVFAEDESSDSEGPMPDIDSGGDDGSSSSEEDA